MKKDSDPNGWRIAALVVGLALALTASAHYIHTKIYCDPTNPSCIKTGPAEESHATMGEAAHDGRQTHPADTTKHDADHARPSDTTKHGADHAAPAADAKKGAGGGA